MVGASAMSLTLLLLVMMALIGLVGLVVKGEVKSLDAGVLDEILVPQ